MKVLGAHETQNKKSKRKMKKNTHKTKQKKLSNI